MPTVAAAQQAVKERKLLAWLYGGTVVLLLVLLFVTYRTLVRYQEGVVSTRRYIELRSALNEVMLDVVDQETSTRGFLLTKGEPFLSPLMHASVRIADDLDRVKAACNAPLDFAQLDSITSLSLNLTERFGNRVQEARRGTFHPDSLLAGREYMDQLRAVYKRFDARLEGEHAVLLLENKTLVGTPLMLSVYALVSLLATALLFTRLVRSVRTVEKARFALAQRVVELDTEVTLRKRFQELNEKILDLSPSGIMTFTAVRDAAGGITDFAWVTSNNTANKLVGREDLVGKRLLEEMPENRNAGLYDAYCEVVTTGQPFERELHYKDGAMDMWVLARALKLDDGFLVVFDDITDRKRAEASKLSEDRFALTGQLMRTVAHEVRNPLTNIGLAMEQIAEEAKAQNALSSAEPFFSIVDRNLKRIGELITGMLESTRKRELQLSAVHLQAVIQEVEAAVKDRMVLKDMRFVTQVPSHLPKVMLDKGLMVLALTNLAVNAVEAMEPSKGILRATVERHSKELILGLRDNGKGIPPEQLDKLFEPFYSGRPGGLGLGLTTARSILAAHRMTIRVESKVGEGTTVFVHMPLR